MNLDAGLGHEGLVFGEEGSNQTAERMRREVEAQDETKRRREGPALPHSSRVGLDPVAIFKFGGEVDVGNELEAKGGEGLDFSFMM